MANYVTRLIGDKKAGVREAVFSKDCLTVKTAAVFFSTGIKSNAELARLAGLEADKGILAGETIAYHGSEIPATEFKSEIPVYAMERFKEEPEDELVLYEDRNTRTYERFIIRYEKLKGTVVIGEDLNIDAMVSTVSRAWYSQQGRPIFCSWERQSRRLPWMLRLGLMVSWSGAVTMFQPQISERYLRRSDIMAKLMGAARVRAGLKAI